MVVVVNSIANLSYAHESIAISIKYKSVYVVSEETATILYFKRHQATVWHTEGWTLDSSDNRVFFFVLFCLGLFAGDSIELKMQLIPISIRATIKNLTKNGAKHVNQSTGSSINPPDVQCVTFNLRPSQSWPKCSRSTQSWQLIVSGVENRDRKWFKHQDADRSFTSPSGRRWIFSKAWVCWGVLGWNHNSTLRPWGGLEQQQGSQWRRIWAELKYMRRVVVLKVDVNQRKKGFNLFCA